MTLLQKLLPAFVMAAVLCTNVQAAQAKSAGAQGSGARAAGAPEIDPALGAAGLVLLVGGTLVLTSRRRPATAATE